MTNFTFPGYKISGTVSESIDTTSYNAVRDADSKETLLTVLKKDRISTQSYNQLANELEIEAFLNSKYALKSYEIEDHDGNFVLIKDGFSGITLRDLISEGISLDRFYALAFLLIDALADIQEKHILHNQLIPENILVNKTLTELKIIGFGKASRLSVEAIKIASPGEFYNNIAYISPEQTGRTDRSIDYRSDFYSLGIIFYEMCTGNPPFTGEDPLAYIHAHLAKEPQPVNTINKTVPGNVSDIILKLLSKSPLDRYQSLAGLKHDLEQSQSGKDNFVLGLRDHVNEIQFPSKLYGRDKEEKMLLDGFDKALNGNSAYLLIAGYSGIGKSSLVNKVHQPIVEKKGLFISGKYDQYQKNIPYSAIAAAFRGLIQYVLTENKEKVEKWRTEINHAVQGKGKILTDIVPELEKLIGKQPDLPEMGPTESEMALKETFIDFIRVFTKKEHPVVLFLDDLQWADKGSIGLLETLVDENQAYLFIIGAYRDNEVDEHHDLMRSVASFRQKGVTIQTITLTPLNREDTKEFIQDIFKLSDRKLDEFTDIIHSKTKGNPFFVRQLIKGLFEDNQIIYTIETGEWQLELDQIRNATISENVADYVLERMGSFTDEQQNCLSIASCIGSEFDFMTLQKAADYEKEMLFKVLQELVLENIIMPLRIDSSKESFSTKKKTNNRFLFLHDRLYQAAYSLKDKKQVKEHHLSIARIQLEDLKRSGFHGTQLFALASHFNQGKQFINDPSERIECAEINLKAGKQAQESRNYDVAVSFFKEGQSFLPLTSWKSSYDLTKSLSMGRAEAEYLNTNFDASENEFKKVLENVTSALEKVDVYTVQVALLTTLGNYEQAMKVGNKGLKALKLRPLPTFFWFIPLVAEIFKAKFTLGKREISSLVGLPKMTSERHLKAMRLLNHLCPPAFFISKNLVSLIFVKMVNMSMTFGNTDVSAYAYSSYGLVLGPALGDFKAGYEFGQMSLLLKEQYDNKAISGRSTFMFAGFVNHWLKPLKEDLPLHKQAFDYCSEAGDFVWAGYSACGYMYTMFSDGSSLDDIFKEGEYYLNFAHKTRHDDISHDFILAKQMVNALKGTTKTRGSFSTATYDEDEHRKTMESIFRKLPLHQYYMHKLKVHTYFAQYKDALEAARQSEKLQEESLGFYYTAEHVFFYALVLSELIKQASAVQKLKYRMKRFLLINKLKKWASFAPANFKHKYLLAKASTLSPEKAIPILTAVIESKDCGDVIQDEALTHEYLGRAYLAQGNKEKAEKHIKKAFSLYKNWGAEEKLIQLKEHYGSDMTFAGTQDQPSEQKSSSQNILETDLDIFSIFKQTRALSGEVNLKSLLKTMISYALESAGADKTILILNYENTLNIEAEGRLNPEKIDVLMNKDYESFEDLPKAVTNYVIQTEESQLLNNVTESDLYRADPYIMKNQPKSVLCLPIKRQNNLVGLLYLENNQDSNVFNEDRIRVLEIMSAQLAISIENIKSLEEKIKANKELQLLNENLEAKVKEQVEKIKAAMETAEQMSRQASLAQLNLGIAHEVRNPLGMMQTKAELIKLRHAEDPEKVKEFTDFIVEQVARIIDVTETMLSFGSSKSGNKESKDVHHAVEELLKMVTPEISRNNIELSLNLNKATPFKSPLDENRLIQALLNVVLNAIQAMDENEAKGIDSTLSVTIEEGRYIDKKQKQRDGVAISITDNGKGMNAETKAKVFDPYFTTKGPTGGKNVGLGMSIMLNIIQDHNGTVEVDSEEGKGTTFKIYLPKAA